jgi:hypothetical protein
VVALSKVTVKVEGMDEDMEMRTGIRRNITRTTNMQTMDTQDVKDMEDLTGVIILMKTYIIIIALPAPTIIPIQFITISTIGHVITM